MARKPAFISHSPEREAEIQGRLLDVLEARFRRRIAEAILDEVDEIATGYEFLGYVPPPMDAAAIRFRDVYYQLALASVRTFGKRILTQAKAAGHVLETKEINLADFFASLAHAWVNLEPVRRRIQGVTDTTRNLIVAQVDRGVRDGEPLPVIARNIREAAPAIARERSRVIARTETHGAANFASHQTAKATGLELQKQWVSVEDHRTRAIWKGAQFDHVAMNGQVRDMDKPFDMPWIGGGGEPLKIMYPGEAGKPGAATINCRCTAIHMVKGLD